MSDTWTPLEEARVTGWLVPNAIKRTNQIAVVLDTLNEDGEIVPTLVYLRPEDVNR